MLSGSPGWVLGRVLAPPPPPSPRFSAFGFQQHLGQPFLPSSPGLRMTRAIHPRWRGLSCPPVSHQPRGVYFGVLGVLQLRSALLIGSGLFLSVPPSCLEPARGCGELSLWGLRWGFLPAARNLPSPAWELRVAFIWPVEMAWAGPIPYGSLCPME